MEPTPTDGIAPVRPSKDQPVDPCSDVEAQELQRLTANISARLRKVCAHLPDDEFSELVVDIVRVRLRYEERAFGHSPMRRAD